MTTIDLRHTTPIEPTTVITPSTGRAVDAGYTAADFFLSDDARDRILNGVPANTRRAYKRQAELFADWCAREGRVPLPATSETLAEYVNDLCDRKLSPASIDQAIAVIRTIHRRSGWKNHPDTEQTRLALRAYGKERAADDGQRSRRRTAPPVTIDALHAMAATCDPTTTIGVRDRLLLVLGLALMGRRSELAALNLSDVREVDKGLEVTIRTSKTDKDSKGETIAVLHGTHPLTDPVTAWRDWTAVLAAAGHTTGRLLRSVTRHGHIGDSISTNAINTAVRSMAVRARVPSADTYTAHSLRAGGATIAYANRAPISQIAEHGRWLPNSPVVLGYIRGVDKWVSNPLRGAL